MSVRRCVWVLIWVAMSAGVVRADGLLYQLPKDGTWASYDLNVSVQRETTMTGILRLASVGQVTEDKTPCRWIEVQIEVQFATRTCLIHQASGTIFSKC